jgi:NTP pyrophosphatase (non-canonical NTP hydrolase)
MGKLLEECGELVAVAARCIIQGIDEVDPSSNRLNNARLSDEVADVLAQCSTTVKALGLDAAAIARRVAKKEADMAEWEAMFPPIGSTEIKPVFVVNHIGSSYGEGMGSSTVLVGRSLCHRALVQGAKLYEHPPENRSEAKS